MHKVKSSERKQANLALVWVTAGHQLSAHQGLQLFNTLVLCQLQVWQLTHTHTDTHSVGTASICHAKMRGFKTSVKGSLSECCSFFKVFETGDFRAVILSSLSVWHVQTEYIMTVKESIHTVYIYIYLYVAMRDAVRFIASVIDLHNRYIIDLKAQLSMKAWWCTPGLLVIQGLLLLRVRE